jgi:hypothetical protein
MTSLFASVSSGVRGFWNSQRFQSDNNGLWGIDYQSTFSPELVFCPPAIENLTHLGATVQVFLRIIPPAANSPSMPPLKIHRLGLQAPFFQTPFHSWELPETPFRE